MGSPVDGDLAVAGAVRCGGRILRRLRVRALVRARGRIGGIIDGHVGISGAVRIGVVSGGYIVGHEAIAVGDDGQVTVRAFGTAVAAGGQREADGEQRVERARWAR